MNALAHQYFYEDANFDEVLICSDGLEKIVWSEVELLDPTFPRGWFELSQVPSEDRLEFIKSFWLNHLPFQPKAHLAISDFFNALDDVSVVLTKAKEHWEPQLVYSLMDNSCFFRGLSPARDDEMMELRDELDFPFPSDFSAFTKIHNGFGKRSELDLLKISQIPAATRRLKEILIKAIEPVRSGETIVDAGTLVPFFETSGLSSFQCFYEDWYPGSEMGNIYFSGIDSTLSDTSRRETWEENGAFPTFLEWLASYLGGMEIAP
jgi:hypothetical protein